MHGYGTQPHPQPPIGVPPHGTTQISNETTEGVKYLSYVLLLSALISFMSFGMAILVFKVLLALSEGNVESAIASAVGLAAGVCVVSGLIFTLIILFIVALIKIWSGRNQYGPQHANNVNMGMIIFVIAIALSIVSSSIKSSYSPADSIQEMYNSMKVSMFISGVLSAVSGALMAIFLIFFIKYFLDQNLKKRVHAGAILMILGPIIGVVAVGALLPENIGDISSDDLILLASVLPMALYLGNIVSAIGHLLYYTAYKSVLNNLVTGVIKPQLAPMPPGISPPPYGMPPQAPPQYPPQTPPPGAPPQYGQPPWQGPPPYPPY